MCGDICNAPVSQSWSKKQLIKFLVLSTSTFGSSPYILQMSVHSHAVLTDIHLIASLRDVAGQHRKKQALVQYFSVVVHRRAQCVIAIILSCVLEIGVVAPPLFSVSAPLGISSVFHQLIYVLLYVYVRNAIQQIFTSFQLTVRCSQKEIWQPYMYLCRSQDFLSAFQPSSVKSSLFSLILVNVTISYKFDSFDYYFFSFHLTDKWQAPTIRLSWLLRKYFMIVFQQFLFHSTNRLHMAVIWVRYLVTLIVVYTTAQHATNSTCHQRSRIKLSYKHSIYY